MAKNQSTNKNRLIEGVIVIFVVVSISLLVIQMGTNVMDTLEEAENTSTEEITPLNTPTPSGPTPTIDYSAPVSEMD